ncbi:hypothetical protein ACI2LF_29115 [Kribbella sp. NPDC020789]
MTWYAVCQVFGANGVFGCITRRLHPRAGLRRKTERCRMVRSRRPG